MLETSHPVVGLVFGCLANFFASNFFNIIYMYISAVYPSSVRATGNSVCIAAGRLGSISAPMIFELMRVMKLGEHGIKGFSVMLAVLYGIGCVMVSLLRVETTNVPSKAFASEIKSDSDETVPLKSAT